MEIRIAHLYPDLLNLYGDRGNLASLVQRCRWRGIEAEVVEYELNDEIDFSGTDIVFLGGGSDREQLLVCEKLREIKSDFAAYVEGGGVTIAICGGYQLLGNYYKLKEETIPGLEILDISTQSDESRLIGDVVLESGLVSDKVVGFENHSGRTDIGAYAPFGKVLSGHGNNGVDGNEGVVYKNTVGTYLHGPLLPKNPQLCDWFLSRALERKYPDFTGLTPLDDSLEKLANEFIAARSM